MDETTGNTIDTDAIVSELQTLNKGIVSSNEKLDSISEYLIAKETQRQDEQSANKKAEAEKAEAEKQQAEAQEQARSEETETYTELLTDLRDDIRLQNQMFAGQILFTGIICGVLLAKIFFDRFKI